MRDLRLSRAEDLAVCHYLGHVSSTRTTGDQADYWVRVTAGCRRLNGQWTVIHEHVSMPFADREAMQAAVASSRGPVAG
jgi:ketosteroid isomerase-like protein